MVTTIARLNNLEADLGNENLLNATMMIRLLTALLAESVGDSTPDAKKIYAKLWQL